MLLVEFLSRGSCKAIDVSSISKVGELFLSTDDLVSYPVLSMFAETSHIIIDHKATYTTIEIVFLLLYREFTFSVDPTKLAST
jgi:hypothetical protein